MTDQGKAIQDCVNNLITIYRELQTLLVSADELVSADRWVPLNKIAVTRSNALDFPEKWLAQYVFRFYHRPEPGHDHMLLYVSAILFDSGNRIRVMEPMLTAGWLELLTRVELDKFWYEDAMLHLDNPGAANDGIVTTHDTASMPRRSRAFSRFGTLAVPLVEIDTTDALKERVIAPLLDRVNEVVLRE